MKPHFLKVAFLGHALRFALADHGHHPNPYRLATSQTQEAVSKYSRALNFFKVKPFQRVFF